MEIQIKILSISGFLQLICMTTLPKKCPENIAKCLKFCSFEIELNVIKHEKFKGATSSKFIFCASIIKLSKTA